MKMKNFIIKIAIAIAGALLGVVSYYCFAGWFTIIPWVAVTLFAGYFSRTRRRSLVNGAVFGYFLFLAYLFIGYRGKTDISSAFHFALFNLAFSLVGAGAGAFGSYIGHWLKTKTWHDRNSAS